MLKKICLQCALNSIEGFILFLFVGRTKQVIFVKEIDWFASGKMIAQNLWLLSSFIC